MRAVTRAVFSLCGQNGKKDENKNIHDCKNFSITTLLFQDLFLLCVLETEQECYWKREKEGKDKE